MTEHNATDALWRIALQPHDYSLAATARISRLPGSFQLVYVCVQTISVREVCRN